MIVNLPNGNSPLEEYEAFSDVDFIITDLDGTLIDGEAPVLGQIKRLITKLKKKHTQITIATGRTYYGAKARMNELGVDVGMPVALYNGGVVMEYGTGNVLYASYVPNKVVQDLLKIVDLKRANIYIYNFSADLSFTIDDKKECVDEQVYVLGHGEGRLEVNGMNVQYISSDDNLNAKISAVLIEKDSMQQGEKEKVMEWLKQYSGIKITDSGNGYIEIKGNGRNKGVIYDILRSHEKFFGKKILEIGDNDNDIELFKEADISVAVANSSALAFASADYICENESAQGFYEMLQVLESAKRYYQ